MVYTGRIRFQSLRRRTKAREVSLPARLERKVAGGDDMVCIDAGPLGCVVCFRQADGTFVGNVAQTRRTLPVRVIITALDSEPGRSLHVQFHATSLDPVDPPFVMIAIGSVEASAAA